MKTSEELKERRLNKFGTKLVQEMSGTTRHYFKKWEHRKSEIQTYEKSGEFKKKQKTGREEGRIKNCIKCGVPFNVVCISYKCQNS